MLLPCSPLQPAGAVLGEPSLLPTQLCSAVFLELPGFVEALCIKSLLGSGLLCLVPELIAGARCQALMCRDAQRLELFMKEQSKKHGCREECAFLLRFPGSQTHSAAV